MVGISLAPKPVLLPVLLLFILWWRWRALALATIASALLSVAGIALSAETMRFVSDNVPFLLTSNVGEQNDVNVSIYCAGGLLGLPAWIVMLSRAGALAAAAGAALPMVRLRRGGEEALRLMDCSPSSCLRLSSGSRLTGAGTPSISFRL